MNQLLYDDLYRLRQRIKDRERQTQGRAPTVCSDNALYEIAELCPKKLTDFQSVSGIGKTFIENYGEEFLTVILKHTEVQTEKKINMSTSAAETLKELEKKLVSINRRNRLLYMPKTSNKYAFDMFEVGSHYLFNLLFGRVPAITLANISEPGMQDSEKELYRFKRIAQLLREVNKDLRDKGQNDLYIGYPYVIGRIPGENFDVRAPLALFPVTAEKTATCIRLSLDESRDVIYNNTLVLAYFKFNNISKPLASDVIESVSESGFISSVLDFYADNEIRIAKEQTELIKFKDYKADEFPRFKSGELHLEPCAILGKFPICSSSIQKDFDDILRNNEINSLLNDLLLSSEEIDYYSDSYSGDEPEDIDTPLTISEKNLVYINELNSSQEAVLSAINGCDELVVQGPPGTGKSQVITSLISEFVSAGKTVLMVSEKKTALDVVYSRLGDLSQYALLIDDVGNKDAFYQQLSKMIHLGCTAEEKMNLDFISEKIDALVKRLEVIADVLYRPNEFGIEPYKLYLQNKRYDLSNDSDRTQVNNIIQLRDARLLDIQYADLERMYQLFSDPVLCSNLERYIDIIASYSWLHMVRGGASI